MASALQNRRHHRGKKNPRALRSGPMTKKQATAAQKKVEAAARVQKQIDAAVKKAAARGLKLLNAQKALDKKEAKKLAKAAVAEYKKAHKAKPRKKRAMSEAAKARKAAIREVVRKLDAEARKSVKISASAKRRSAEVKAWKKAHPAKSKKSAAGEQLALMNRGKRRKARNNGLGRARHNGIYRRAHRNGLLGDARSYVMSVAPWVVGGIGGYALHEAAAMAGEKALGVPLTKKIEGALVKIPAVGAYAASLSNTLQGAAVAVLLNYVAKKVGGKAAPYIKDTGISALVIGVVKDASRLKDANWSVSAIPLGDLAFGDLAFGDLAFGDLAFGDVSALGGVSALSGVSALGDGLAYETAPLSADYSQASLGDAYYCGADFSADEGQCMINGRGHYMHRYGSPPHRMQHNPKGSSHLAGREGHRWGWLVKMVGWQKAAQIAAMAPESRVKVIQKLRAAALQAFQMEMRNYEAAQIAREIPEQLSDLVPSAGAPMGAQGASEAPLGDSALFMGA